ncbi:Alpha/Beta hydrolase protein [Mycena floridula]|nr:Alpha/Beta hydrolase protein [Mycena floridula]
MDPTLYKTIIAPRGIKYHYFASPAVENKPTILFLHGFPSTANDWRYQVAFFAKEGFGIIVPDMLGYGGTDKPTDAAVYNRSLIAQDIIAILDAENVAKAFVVSHDWGSAINSALATYHPARFDGFAFLAVGFTPPNPNYDPAAAAALFKSFIGYEPFGYMLFFAEDGADKILEDHMESFISIIYPEDPKTWLSEMAPQGALKAWVLRNAQTPPPAYISEQDRENIKQALLAGGLAAPLCWYRNRIHGFAAADDEGAPKEGYTVQKPVFFGAALQDYVCVPKIALAVMNKTVTKLTVKEYDCDHWVQLAKPDEVNKDLLEWISQIQ